MKKTLVFLAVAAATSFMLTSCGTKQYMESYAPEESALNLVKITDEANNSVLASTLVYGYNFTKSNIGGNSKNRIYWSTPQCLAISPDGKKLAYMTYSNRQSNIMVRNAGPQGVSTQRTFRDVSDMSWGADGNLYFSDINGYNSFICSVNAEAGSMMSQHTNGNVNDVNPIYSGKNKLYFTRKSGDVPSIWSFDKSDGTLTSCARGFNPCCDPTNPNAFYCVRNNTNGRSEIWYVDYVKGQENLIVSDENRSFTNPQLSPDGKWLLLVGNAKSSITKKNNLDIFVVRTNGSSLTQLTYHPQNDVSPVWGKDGRTIYFISSRANKSNSYNVWRMNFNME